MGLEDAETPGNSHGGDAQDTQEYLWRCLVSTLSPSVVLKMDFLGSKKLHKRTEERFRCRGCCQPSTKAFGSAAALLPFPGQEGRDGDREGGMEAGREG